MPPSGLLSITSRLHAYALAWSSLTSIGNAGLQLRNGPVYSIFGVGTHTRDGSRTVSPSIYLGGHIDVDPAYVEIDAGYSGDFATDGGPPSDTAYGKVVVDFQYEVPGG